MSADVDKAFEVCEGFLVEDAVAFLSGSGTPLTSDAPLGSAYKDVSTGLRWKKVGPNTADWVVIDDSISITQAAHGFTLPAFGFLPLTFNNVSGLYELADASSTTTAADCVATAIPDANTLVLQEGGFINVPAHGLDVGKWYVLRAGLAGLILPYDTVAGSEAKIQYLCFVVDANNVLLRIDPIFTQPFIPQNIAILEDWAQGAQPVTISAGSDRILMVSVNWEDQAGSTLITSMDVGGEAGTLVVEQSIISGLQYAASTYYWDEAQIQAMSGTTLTLGWSAGAPTFFQSAAVLIGNVDQTSPIVAVNSDSGTGGTDTLDADVNTIIGGYAFQVSGGGNAAMGFTNNGAGWTRRVDLTITSADGVIDDKSITATATPENVNMGITGSNRHVLIAGSLRRRET